MPKRTHQVAALPWRRGESGVEILLVTTRTTKRWVIPKGWTMEGKADHEAAAIEAYEEAGAKGIADHVPIATYRYKKILKNGKSRVLQVQVFSMPVQEMLDDWPEALERKRQWVTPERAMSMTGDIELIPVLAIFGGIRLSFVMRLKLFWHRLFG